ncbi:hypothetical protein N2601_21645 (plasmid) [Rhizobium sp. CB3060]|nr:hypothetical protein [Rhizobium tropici]UWU24751.1 hypothetical protein N2601_21645 [Rhizobium tropici]
MHPYITLDLLICFADCWNTSFATSKITFDFARSTIYAQLMHYASWSGFRITKQRSGRKMVSAISAATTGSQLSSTSTTSSTSDDAAKIEAQIAAKKAQLANTKDPDEAETLQKALAALEAKLAKLEKSAGEQSSTAGQSTKTGTASNTSSESTSSNSKQQSSLSGESDRIGSTNFDKDSEFGDRTAYV